MTSVLVVEDDASIGATIDASLRSQRYQVQWVRNGVDAIAEARLAGFDLILLDLGLPDADGVDVCRALRVSQPAAVIVILTARDEEIDVVVGLEAGADDYLTKPIRLTELLARVRAHLRRGPTAPVPSPSHRLGNLLVDTGARRAWLGDHEVWLRSKEFDLLARLAAQPGTLVSRDDLMSDVWDMHWHGSTKTLDVHITALRRRLADAATAAALAPPTIVTVRGRGYRLQDEQP